MAAIVSGIGSIPADIMIVGEAPGPIEAKAGYPFAGPLAKFVVPLVLAMPGSVYLTNAVKRPRFRAGRIRKTVWEDVEEDLPFLRRELKGVRPKVTIALGDLAHRALLVTGHVPIALPHPRSARIRKRAFPFWLKLVKEASRKAARLLRR